MWFKRPVTFAGLCVVWYVDSETQRGGHLAGQRDGVTPRLPRRVVGEVALESARQRTGGCTRPVRLRGSTALVNTRTGEKYRSTDLVHWEPVEVHGSFPPPLDQDLPAACSRRDPGYKWVSEPPLRVGDEVFRLSPT